MKIQAASRIGDYQVGPARQHCGELDQATMTNIAHVGGAQVPKQLPTAAAWCEAVRHGSHQIAMRHPALQHARPPLADEPNEPPDASGKSRKTGRTEHIDRHAIRGKRIRPNPALAHTNHALY
jgi:hypothetical protein